jgi:FOG: Glucan-binding domain (YG repeat)
MKKLKLRNLMLVAAITLVATATFAMPTKASAAWRQADNSSWSYIDGDTAVSGWKLIEGKWYFFDSNSVMKTGWINDGGKWYYLASSGEMKTGWINDGGKWYYANTSGDMQTGWLLNNGAWYYLNPAGDMKTGLLELNGRTYYLSESGSMKTGNITVNGVNYTFAASGEKIDSSSAVNQTATTTTTTTTDTSNSSTGSSGGSGGSGSNGGATKSSMPSYLYGTWTVSNVISKGSLSDDNAEKAIGQQFTISEDSVSATVPGFGLVKIPNPSVRESTMTVSAFKSKFNINADGTLVNVVHLSYLKYSGDILVTENGTKYVSYPAKNALFELK